ncbi:MAG: hypothetical protein OHK0048_18540 [Rhodoferax sp.]
MNLVPIDIDAIVIGQPLPCELRDESGVLLANKGFLVKTRQELEYIVGKRSDLYIDADQSEAFRRAYTNKINDMVLKDETLDAITKVQLSPYDGRPQPQPERSEEANWLDWQHSAHTLLREPPSQGFLERLDRLHAELGRALARGADGALFALLHLAGSEIRKYSATHAMLVATVVWLTARDVLKWPPERIRSLVNAALTMNLSMTALQDRMAEQRGDPTEEQMRLINSHPARSVDMLQQMGVTDPLWLEAVLYHAAREPGPLASRPPGQQLARLIRRADVFAAKLSPRVSRPAEAPGVAIQSIYFDENHQPDEAGAALIKAVGVYPPGTFVRLASNEVAIVVRRGIKSTMPRVAVLLNRQGMATGEPILRDTALPDYRVTASVPHRDVKINHSLDRLLALTRSTPPVRNY